MSARGRRIQTLLDRGAITTPCLIIDADEIDRLLDLFRRHLPFVQLQYSVKANNAPEVIRHLHSRGVGFDVASASEAELTTAHGVPPERLILSNAIHPRSTLEDIFTRGIPLVTLDNENALMAIAAEASRRGKTPPAVLIRIWVPSINSQLDLNTKFGCSSEQAVRLFDIARDVGVRAEGVHFHVGTQCWDVETYRLAVIQAQEVLASTEANGHTGRVLNIGGGMPDPQMAEKAGGLEAFFEGLAKVIAPIHEQGFELIAEPGRVLVSSACTAVCTVVGRAERDGLPWLYLDDGIYGMFSAIYFEKREFRFETLAPSQQRPASYMIAGPTCDSIDTLGTFTLVGDPQPGAVLIAPDAGAYSVSVKCHFNGFAHINTYLVNSSFCQEHAPDTIAATEAARLSMVYQNTYLQEYWPEEPHNRDMWEDNLELMRAYYDAAREILYRRGKEVQALDISTGPCLAPLLATMACMDDVWLSDFTESSRKAIQEVPISYWRNYAKYLIQEFALEVSERSLLDQLDRLRNSHPVLDVDLARRPVFLPESAEIGCVPLVTMHFVADSICTEKQQYFEYLATACSYVAERGFLLMSSLTDSQWWMLAGTRQPSPGVTEQEVLSFLEARDFDILSVVRSRIKPQQTYQGGWIVTLAERREEQ